MSPRTPNRRIRLLLLGFVLLFAVTLGRAAWLQVVKGADYQQLAVRQHRETVPIPAGRGTIFDRTGEPLAIGEQTTTVFADPKAIQDPRQRRPRGRKGVRSRAELPLPGHHEPQARLRLRRAQGRSDRGGRSSSGRTSPGSASTRRRSASTPRDGVAAQVVGFAGTDNRGLEGLEHSLDSTARREGGQRDDRQGPVRPRRRRRQVAPREPRQERDADDRPPDPGQRRVDPRRDRAQVAREGRLGDRARPAHRPDPGDGERAGLRLEPVRVGQPRSAPQPCGHRRLRAWLDVQARDHLGGARGRHRHAANAVHAAADDPRRRPDDPRRRDAQNRAHDRPADPRALLERRHRDDRREARAGELSRWVRRWGFGIADRGRLPG